MKLFNKILCLKCCDALDRVSVEQFLLSVDKLDVGGVDDVLDVVGRVHEDNLLIQTGVSSPGSTSVLTPGYVDTVEVRSVVTIGECRTNN